MNIKQKLECFDYFITSLLCKRYYEGEYNDPETIVPIALKKAHLSKLKLMKLLFFTTAVNVNDDWYLLDNVFDDFYALPYGPVESPLYNSLVDVKNYTIDSSSVDLKSATPDFSYSGIDQKAKTTIDNSLDALFRINPNLFNMGAFELVELSHRNVAWKIAMNEAKSVGLLSRKMPNELIKQSKLYLQ